MDEGKIVLVGNESDVLHCGYCHSISDDGKRYPSAVHYVHSMILAQLGVPDDKIMELLCVRSPDVAATANSILRDNMVQGHTMETLAQYLQNSRQSYTMIGLRARVEQDPVFAKTLMETEDKLLIVCDKNDRELGIGLDEQGFMEWMKREKADYQTLTFWMRNEGSRPPTLGANHLGFFLMWLRCEVNQKKRQAMLSKPPMEMDGISADNDDKPLRIFVSDLVISLEGIFRPLSNYYPLKFLMKEEKYRSVEHYAYEKLFDALKLNEKAIEKIRTTVDPVDVPVVARRVFENLQLKPEAIQNKMSKMDRWRQSAMKHKITQLEYLQQLLLSTGDAILIDCAEGEPMWTCSSSEAELQHLLTKPYVTASLIIDWMRNKDNKTPRAVSHLMGNKTGLLLMELRNKLANNTQDRIPLVNPLSPSLFSTTSQHIICFTAESVWHPLYPAEIRASPEEPLLPSPAHYIAQQAAKYLAFNKEDTDYVFETRSSLECWQRLHETIEYRGREMDRVHSWWMERRQKAVHDALQLLLEQHPPLLRALLDTGDAMLVYCARFSSIEAELSVGMREVDLRTWLKVVDISSAQLLEMCSHPMAFRPPYLGGNRLGLILMQLRREFILRGVCPHALPELPIAPEVILGTDSPTESMLVTEPFDILHSENYSSLWINPFFLLAKDKKDPELMAIASCKKIAPRFVTVDESKISEVIATLDSMDGKIDDSVLASVDAEDLRAVFMKLCTRLRQRMFDVERQHGSMNFISNEVSRLQNMRRGLEDTRDRHLERAAGGKEREEPRERERDVPPPRRIIERDYKLPVRRNRSPMEPRPKRDQQQDRERRIRSPYRERERPAHSPIRKREKLSTPPPPVVPKPKVQRPPDAELSDGEILSSDED